MTAKNPKKNKKKKMMKSLEFNVKKTMTRMKKQKKRFIKLRKVIIREPILALKFNNTRKRVRT